MSESSTGEDAVRLLAMPRPTKRALAAANERSLIRSAQRGSADAVETLVRSHWPDAYVTALGIVGEHAAAEDVAQEGLLAAIRALDRFDGRRPLRPWLRRIVANRALDWVRADRRRAEVHLERAEETDAGPLGASPGLSDDLFSALRTLDPRDRTIVVLRHLGEFDSKEIGEVVEMSPTAVRSALARALARLREHLDDVPEATDRSPGGTP